MIASAQEIHNGKRLICTVCIVGGGAAGLTLALELDKFGIDVILLEGGGLSYEEKTQALHGGENVSFKPFDITSTRQRMLGGTTNHWGGMAPRLSPSDFEKHAHIPHSGWPIKLVDLEPFYDTAEQYCQISKYWSEYVTAGPGKRETLGFVKGPLNLSLTPWSPPTRFGVQYRAQLSRAKNIRTLIYANVVEVQTDSTGTQVNAVRVRTLANTEFFVNAEITVLATGGLEVPRLLLASNRQHSTGLGNQQDLVGRYYMDHIGLWSGAAMFAGSYSGFDYVSDFINHGDTRAWYTLVPTAAALQERKMVNFRYLLSQSPVSYEGVSASALFIEEISKLRFPSEIGSRLASILLDIDQLAAKALSGHVGQTNISRIQPVTLSGKSFPQAVAMISMEQLPNPNSRVTLSEQRNSLGEKLLKLDWRITHEDKQNLLTAAKMLGQSLGANSVGRMYIPKFLRDLNVETEIEIACHHMGTTRMANDEKNGVVDSELRVHGINNLYISSSSVFPTGGWANPTLTIVALSIRLAKHLQQKLKLK